jgi:hypothetical protein
LVIPTRAGECCSCLVNTDLAAFGPFLGGALSVERNLLAVPQDVQLRRLPGRDANEKIVSPALGVMKPKLSLWKNFTVPMAFLWPLQKLLW